MSAKKAPPTDENVSTGEESLAYEAYSKCLRRVRDKAKTELEAACTRLVHEHFDFVFNAVSCRLRHFQKNRG